MDPLPPLNLPAYAVDVREGGAHPEIRDPVRRKYVRLTPEEWVRQHLLRHLMDDRGYPAALLAIEKAFLYQGMTRRADIVAYDRQARALVLVECKAPDVPVTQAVFDQVAGYNRILHAPYLVVTNGLVHYVCYLDIEQRTYTFLDEIPTFTDAAQRA